MFRLFLIRGLPGTGKTALARIIAPFSSFSNDDYWGEAPGGGYVRVFDIDVHRDHAVPACLQRTLDAMQVGVPVIAVHNTFTRLRELEPYHAAARGHGYSVSELVCTTPFGSVHPVPADVLARKAAEWETR